jgi:hypothetical protein
MTNNRRQLSNPSSTGGAGIIFETHVQASFVTLMLSGGFAPCLPPWQIKKIKLQGKYAGYDTDDAIVFVESSDGKEERKLLCQIKHSISIGRNKVFAGVIQSAWSDFNNPGVFTKGKDLIALITGPLSDTDITDVRFFILEQARHSESSGDFLTRVNLAKFSSERKIKKLKVFRELLKKANNGDDVPDETFWEFMKSFHLLGYDLDIKSGVTLSLLQSLIGQHSSENPQALWTQIIDEVQSANQNAGTITVDSVSEEIRSAFQKRGVETIPTYLGIKPSSPQISDWNNFEFASELAITNLLGAWNEQCASDKEIVERLASEKYTDWISKVREILQWHECPFSLKNGIWTVVKRREMWQALGSRLFDDHLDKFKQCAVNVLKEPDPKFELPCEERYAANIHGKVLKHSHALRKGLAESIALLGSQPDTLKNCSQNKAESVAVIAIREILSEADWILWASLNYLLPTLAEAAPEEFLSAAENALKMTPCPFDEIFSQERAGIFGNNYMSGLLWALETLAWDEQYLVRATVILGNLASRDPGGNWGNRPANSLTTIFLPWLPQTIASVEKRKVAIQTLQKEFPAIAWKLLLDLLPGQTRSSSGSHKPDWRRTIPEDWKKGVTNKEYWDQISSYADIAVDIAKEDFTKLKELISNLDNLTKPSFDRLLDYLGSTELASRPEEERTPLWQVLLEFVLKHKRFKDADWALSAELVEKIEQAAKSIAPQKPQNLYSRLFSQRELYEESGNWEEQRRKLEERRRNAINEIIKYDGLNAVFQFAEIVDSPQNVGISLGFVGEDNIDSVLLPALLETANKKMDLFVSGFVWGRHRNKGWEWVNQVDTSKWSKEQIGKFLSYLPFAQKTWEYSEQLLREHETEYWTKVDVNPYQAENNLDFAIDKLIKHSRPKAAIGCAFAMLNLKKAFNKTQTIKALLDAVSSAETDYATDVYEITEIIKALQDDGGTNQDDLFNIEWAYLPLLTGPGRTASPKILEQKLASDPGFFCEAISLLYRSTNDTESHKEHTEQQKMIAENVWRLLDDWRTLPGMRPDGSFSVDKFNSWLDTVKTKCEQSGHLEVALSTIGKVLIYYIPDPDGLCIHKALAEALNADDAEKMRNGFRIGIFNSRGVHEVDPTGKPEKELAAKYRQQAEEVENAGYYRFAITLKSLSDSYDHEAERIIEEHKDFADDPSE